MKNDKNNGAIVRLLEEHLASASSSWSIGVPGAVAEFHRDDLESCSFENPRCAVTDLGALRFEALADVRAHAYEILSARPRLWHHGVVLSLPARQGVMSRRGVITEVGPDREAIRGEDRESMLFDLALGSPYCDFYVRASDPGDIARLRRAVGTSLLDPCCELFDDIVHMSPHRVFVSKLARIEIYQRIGNPAAHTPHGPHTHLLPRLFRPQRSHMPNIALPTGRTPCLTLYPANPVFDREGSPKRFDPAQHDAFQALLSAHGDASHVATKHAVWDAARSGLPPESLAELPERRARIACRVALRQMLQIDGASAMVSQWHAAFEPSARAAQLHSSVREPVSARAHEKGWEVTEGNLGFPLFMG